MLAVRVDVIAALHLSQHLLEIGLLAARQLLPIASIRPLPHAGIQIDLEIGVRHDHCADIAAHHHHTAGLPDAPLLQRHRRPHAAVGRHR